MTNSAISEFENTKDLFTQIGNFFGYTQYVWSYQNNNQLQHCIRIGQREISNLITEFSSRTSALTTAEIINAFMSGYTLALVEEQKFLATYEERLPGFHLFLSDTVTKRAYSDQQQHDQRKSLAVTFGKVERWLKDYEYRYQLKMPFNRAKWYQKIAEQTAIELYQKFETQMQSLNLAEYIAAFFEGWHMLD